MTILLAALLYPVGQTGQDDAVIPNGFRSVKIPLLVRRFVDEEATAFAVGQLKGADYVLAACDKQKRLRVAFGSGGRGKVFSTRLQAERSTVMLRDLTGDGRAEVVVAADQLAVYRIGEDGLSLVWTGKETYRPGHPPQIRFGDFNGDRRTDIAVLNYKDRNSGPEQKCLYLYLQRDSDSVELGLSGSVTMTDDHGYHSTAELAVADFDGDSAPELVAANHNGYMWLVRVEDGKPIVVTHWTVPAGGAVGGLAVGNLMPDARPELLVGTNGGDIFVYGFSDKREPKLRARAMAGRLAYGVSSADVDNDGLDEFLLTRGYLGYAGMTEADVVAEVWEIEGPQLKPRWRLPLLGFKSAALSVSDFNGDGLKDFVLYSPEGGQLRVLNPDLDE